MRNQIAIILAPTMLVLGAMTFPAAAHVGWLPNLTCEPNQLVHDWISSGSSDATALSATSGVGGTIVFESSLDCPAVPLVCDDDLVVDDGGTPEDPSDDIVIPCDPPLDTPWIPGSDDDFDWGIGGAYLPDNHHTGDDGIGDVDGSIPSDEEADPSQDTQSSGQSSGAASRPCPDCTCVTVGGDVCIPYGPDDGGGAPASAAGANTGGSSPGVVTVTCDSSPPDLPCEFVTWVGGRDGDNSGVIDSGDDPTDCLSNPITGSAAGLTLRDADDDRTCDAAGAAGTLDTGTWIFILTHANTGDDGSTLPGGCGYLLRVDIDPNDDGDPSDSRIVPPSWCPPGITPPTTASPAPMVSIAGHAS